MKQLLLFVCVLSALGCATAPVAYESGKQQGRWDAKAQVKDLKENKTHVVTLDVIGKRPDQVRMEVSGSLGVSLASLVINQDQVAYAIYPQKRYFSGEVSDQALRPLFKVDLNPKYLMNVFFDQSIPEKNWTCTVGEDQLVQKCERLSDALSIIWSDRKGEQKKVFIKSDTFQVQLVVKDFTTKVETSDATFLLTAPEGYRSYKLR